MAFENEDLTGRIKIEDISVDKRFRIKGYVSVGTQVVFRVRNETPIRVPVEVVVTFEKDAGAPETFSQRLRLPRSESTEPIKYTSGEQSRWIDMRVYLPIGRRVLLAHERVDP